MTLSLADITLSTYDYTQGGTNGSSEGTALIFGWTDGGTSGQLRIANLGQHIEEFEFADGATYTADELFGFV